MMMMMMMMMMITNRIKYRKARMPAHLQVSATFHVDDPVLADRLRVNQ